MFRRVVFFVLFSVLGAPPFFFVPGICGRGSFFFLLVGFCARGSRLLLVRFFAAPYGFFWCGCFLARLSLVHAEFARGAEVYKSTVAILAQGKPSG